MQKSNHEKRTRVHERATFDGERLVRMRELETLVGLRKSTINRLILEGRFPQRVYPLGNRIAAWRYSEIAQWIADGCAKSDAEIKCR